MILHPDFEAARKERSDVFHWVTNLLKHTRQSLRQIVPVTLGRSTYSLRSLYRTEVETLERNGCTSNDWRDCRLLISSRQSEGLDMSAQLNRLVSRTHLSSVVLLVLPIEDEAKTANYGLGGLHRCSVVADSIISLEAIVLDNGMIQNAYIQPNAKVVRCGQITGSGSIVDSNSSHNAASLEVLHLSVGPESGGGRSVYLSPESTMIEVGQQLKHPPQDDGAISSGNHDASSLWTIIASNAVMRDTPTVEHVYLHPRARIEAASCVRRTLLHSQAAIQGPCTVEDTRMQWHASISSGSYVTHSLLQEHAGVGPASATVTHSVLGPDVHVSCGEVHASVLGPNTNAHHQSLLISVLWLLGRGNVGYGANVGSNHTGRLPDQESVAGEGIFWGLSNVIPFPVNLNEAPYTIVAAGTKLVPQSVVRMPFSLIVTNNEANDFTNTILPGWVCSSSPYTLARAATKFATRRKAQRHASYTGWDIWRPHTMRLILQARQLLSSVNDTGVGSLYTEREIAGLGQGTVLTEKARLAGIRAYTDCLQRYCLHGLLQYLKEHPQTDATLQLQSTLPYTATQLSSEVNWGPFPWEETDNTWEFQKSVLMGEFPIDKTDASSWMRQILTRLVELEHDYSRKVQKCKARDDTRGQSTIPGYSAAHVAARQDDVVQQVLVDAQKTASQVDAILGNEDTTKRPILSKL